MMKKELINEGLNKELNERHYTVYKLTFSDGKVYIGQTGNDVERRWNNGQGYLNKNKKGRYFQPKIAKAIIRDGWVNVEKEIIADNLTKEEAETLEKTLIELMKSYDSEFGYNSRIGNALSLETRRKMSKAHLGEKNGMYNRNHTEYAKMRIGMAKSKGVVCLNTGIVYSSIKLASEETNIPAYKISAICKGLIESDIRFEFVDVKLEVA